MKGGGWESRADIEAFEAHVPTGKIAIVLSATTYGANQGTQYFYDYYRARSSHPLIPIYTYEGGSGENDADSTKHLPKIAQAAGIIITGGDPQRLKHLVGNALGQAIHDAYQKGTPVYANSAGLSILGPYFSWNLSSGKFSIGLGLIAAPVISHVNDFNLYCDLWNLVPAHSAHGFGIEKDTMAEVVDGHLRVHEVSVGRVYHYKTRPTNGCTPPQVGAEGATL